MTELSIPKYREVLGHFATGVVVIAAMTPEGPVGFTCQSFAGLSLEPLLVTFAAQRNGSSWPRMQGAGSLAISVLGEDQESVARTFATSGIDKFAAVAWSPGTNGAPQIAGSIAIVEASIEHSSEHGDHDIVVAAVTGLEARAGAPLLYFRGGFGTFAV
ncbi:unannotated protein [freshwater metagenome]|uniref:Unannotated protein n=1 Tax=freshwater metagenome TaxID=449393 RepID=A0A6J6WHG9_9ZZZZ